MGLYESLKKIRGSSGGTSSGLNSFSQRLAAADKGWQREEKKEKRGATRINKGLDQGRSWEDISAKTGISLDRIREFSQQTRPDYGITPKPQDKRNVFSKLLDQQNIFDSGRSFKTAEPSQEQRKKSTLSQAKDIAKIVGSSYERVGKGVAETLAYDTASQRGEREAQSRLSERNTQLIANLSKQLKNPKLPPAKRKQLLKVMKLANIGTQETSRAAAGRGAEIAERTDPVKGGAAVAGIGFDILTAGTLGGAKAGLQAGKLAPRILAREASEQALRSGVRRVIEPAITAGIGGGVGAVEQYGKDVTGRNIATGAATGTALGAFLGGAPQVPGLLKKGASRVSVPTITSTRFGEKAAQTQIAKKITNLKDNFVAKVIDDTNFIKKPFKGVVDDSTGRKVVDEIEDKVTNVRQFAALSQSRLENNQAFQGIKQLIGGNKKNYKDFGEFINRKQNAINQQKLGKGGRVATGTAEQEEAYRLLNQSTKDDVQYLFDNEIIDGNKYKQWMDDPDYTRVQREIGEDFSKKYGNKGLVSGTSVTGQKLKGSTKKAVDPFAAYEDWQRRITLEVERNKLGKYIRDQGLKRGVSNKVDTASAGYERLKQLYGEEGVKQKTLPIFEKGMKELYTIDPRAARQLANSPDLELRAIADWALLPSRVLRGGATSLNAAFAVPNFIRDQISSAVISKNVKATHNPIAFWGGFKEAVLKPTGNAVLRKIPGVKDEVFQASPLFKEYLSRNANMTSVDLARNLKKATRQAQENLGVKGESVIRRYENIISASEKATRYQNFLGTYKNAIKKGIPDEQAIERAQSAARTNSINFSNRGEIAVFAKIFNPYFNAGVQGARTLGNAFKTRPIATGMKIGTGIMAPVAAATYYNLSDPERAELYARIPDYERKGNLIMVLGGDRGYIKIPLPPGMREFANPLRNYVESEYLGDRQGLLETAKNLFVDPFSPVGTTKNELLSQAVPQGVKPIIEVGMNKDLYTGKEIIPENLKGLPEEEQVFGGTQQSYRDIGKILGVSPLQVRKVVAGYGAGGVEGALATFDQARGKESGNRAVTEQIVKRFYGKEPGEGSNQVKSKFYETYSPIKSKKEATSKKITAAIKANDYGKANQLANELNDEVEREKKRLKEGYGRFETDLSVLYDQFDGLKFPVSGGRLSEGSIAYRKKL